MSDTKLSVKMKNLCQEMMKREGVTWQWLKDNTYFPEWIRDAQDMERYIELMKKGSHAN